ncbi:PREDICTED: ras-related protein Rab-34-like [Polistes canadensis]|uniref:ras-related protein Rab-34-like n=1 Tax=Polistes canadensis TaxID=91411 RepID=UPI000718B2E4|nr:PREDICTED: ras-related protein Rab-34-like [Polistes canadensis]
MLETRSAVFKLMKTNAHEERQIHKWPPPFSSAITPYYERDFNDVVKQACAEKSFILRISKVIVIGDVAVGKTSLTGDYDRGSDKNKRRKRETYINNIISFISFCHKLFDNNYKATIGVDFEVERFDVLGVPFHLQIWDTAGQERFKCIAASYYRAANAIIVVFDVGNLLTLAHCQQWLIEAYKSNTNFCHVFLVGMKRDLLSNKVYEIIENRAIDVANRMRAEYWTVSARTGDGVNELFARVASLCFNAMVLRELENNKIVPMNIGSDLITLESKSKENEDNIKKKIRSKCFDCLI